MVALRNIASRASATALATVLVGMVSCAVAGCGDDSAPPLCGDTRSVAQVYYGTDRPTFAPLTPAQVLAVGQVGPCSGTLIAPSWVLSAQHCDHNVGARFCMGEQPNAPDQCVSVVSVHPEPTPDSDLMLLELEFDARLALPSVEPIPILTELLDAQWVGEYAEGAGYGQAENGTLGTRYFTAEPIRALETEFVVLDGEGVHGLCAGDSGGPVLVIASDNSARVAGALTGGDASCVGIDRYYRLDRVYTWIESFTGPTQVGPSYCGGVDQQGLCTGERAVWCDGTSLVSETCGGLAACGWDDGAGGFRCVTGVDPCAGYDRRGACEDNAALWCENGQLLQRQCDDCSERCFVAGSPEGAYCIASACGGLDYLGRCNGDVAEWCTGDAVRSVDCGAMGQSCGYIDDTIGYYCI